MTSPSRDTTSVLRSRCRPTFDRGELSFDSLRGHRAPGTTWATSRSSVNGGAFAPIAGDGVHASTARSRCWTPPTDGQHQPARRAGRLQWHGRRDGARTAGCESQVDLTAAGVDPGDTIQLRLAMGRDGCGGNNPGGWLRRRHLGRDLRRRLDADADARPPTATATAPRRPPRPRPPRRPPRRRRPRPRRRRRRRRRPRR